MYLHIPRCQILVKKTASFAYKYYFKTHFLRLIAYKYYFKIYLMLISDRREHRNA